MKFSKKMVEALEKEMLECYALYDDQGSELSYKHGVTMAILRLETALLDCDYTEAYKQLLPLSNEILRKEKERHFG